MVFFIPWRVVAENSGAAHLDLLGPPGLAGGAVANSFSVIFRFGATMELGRSERTTMRPPWRYGVSFATTRSQQFAGGVSPPCALSAISGWRDGALYPLARGCRAPRRIMPELEATAPPIPVWGILFGKFVLPGSVGGAGGVRHRELRGQRRQHPDRNNAVRCTLCGWSGRTVGSASSATTVMSATPGPAPRRRRPDEPRSALGRRHRRRAGASRQRSPPAIKPNRKSQTEIGGGARRRLACAWKTP